jgi:hypothetical protein
MDLFKYFTIICAVSSILLSVFSYRRSKYSNPIKKPIFLYKTKLLPRRNKLKNKLFSNIHIFNFYKVCILFCNKGTKTILPKDLPSNCFPEIVFNNDVKIRCPKIRNSSSERNGFDVVKEKNNIKIIFKYLNHDDGIVFEILYFANSKNIPAKLEAQFTDLETAKLVNYKFYFFRITFTCFILVILTSGLEYYLYLKDTLRGLLTLDNIITISFATVTFLIVLGLTIILSIKKYIPDSDYAKDFFRKE